MSRDGDFRIVSARSGKPNLVFMHEGAALPVYSRHDPERDGERRGRDTGSPGPVVRVAGAGGGRRVRIFPGLGLGYHIAPFLRGEDAVLVVEPDENLLHQVRELEPVRRVLADPRVTLYGGGDAGRFTRDLAGSYDLLFHHAVEVHGLPSLRRVPRYGGLERELVRQVNALAADGLTIGRFARRWVVNFLGNLPREQDRSLALVSSLYGRGRGTAVIAGAGPSLDRVLGDLRRRRTGCYLVAVDAAVMPLLASGITPDLVVTLDAQPAVRLHFSGLPRGGAATALFRDVPVVTSFLSPPPVFGLFERRFLFATAHPLFHALTGFSGAPGEGAAGAGEPAPGSVSWRQATFSCRAVSSLAFQVAAAMGFDTIVLAGLDFSCPGLRCYARRSFFYRHAAAAAHRFSPPLQEEAGILRRSTDAGNRGLRTSANLLDYRLELESIIENSGVEVVRWESKGALIRGCRDLAEPPLTGGAALPGLSAAEVPPRVELDLTGGAILITMALRERLFRGAGSREEALAAARASLWKIANRHSGNLTHAPRPGSVKFGPRRSDIEGKA